MKRIFLVGFMGSGKTTVGRLLAERLHYEFIDLDEEICRRVGRTIPDIFQQEGEAAFRRLETEMLKEIACRERIVVALGGGAFVAEENRGLIQRQGLSVWLDCPLSTIRHRLEGVTNRPLFGSAEQVEALYHHRLSSYAHSDLRINAAQSSPEEVVEDILSRLKDGPTGKSS